MKQPSFYMMENKNKYKATNKRRGKVILNKPENPSHKWAGIFTDILTFWFDRYFHSDQLALSSSIPTHSYRWFLSSPDAELSQTRDKNNFLHKGT